MNEPAHVKLDSSLTDGNGGPVRAPTLMEERGAGVVDLLLVLGRHKRLVFSASIVAAVLAATISFLVAPTYTAAAKILPPQQAQSTAAAMLSQLGGLAGSMGGGLGVKTPSDLYIAMLKSNTIADRLIARFDLKTVYRKNYQVDARNVLAANSRFASDKSGVISIEVDAKDPRLSADIANAYVAELYTLTGTLAATEAAQRRVFFERQVEQTRDKLADAEVRLRQALESGGFVSVDVQSRATMETIGRLRGQISAKEIQIGAMRTYATSTNPDLRRAEQEMASMRDELARLESGVPSANGERRRDARSQAEAAGVKNIRLLRDVKYHEVLFEMLSKQYELARVDESKEAPIIQTLDKALPPELKSKPKRTVFVVFGAAIGFLTGVFGAFLLNALEALQSDPAQRGKLQALRSAWLRR